MSAWEKRLLELKTRLDAIDDAVIHALRGHDDLAIERAMEQQSVLLRRYTELLKKGRATGQCR